MIPPGNFKETLAFKPLSYFLLKSSIGVDVAEKHFNNNKRFL